MLKDAVGRFFWVCLEGVLIVALSPFLLFEAISASISVPDTQQYQYEWLAYPFGDPHYFFVEAKTQEEADILAKERFDWLRSVHATIMEEFHAVS